MASRLILGPTSFLSKEDRRLFPGNTASGASVENLLVIFLISSEIVYADFHFYVSLPKKIHKFIATRNKTT
jgi:hypothetical protein